MKPLLYGGASPRRHRVCPPGSRLQRPGGTSCASSCHQPYDSLALRPNPHCLLAPLGV